MCESSGLETVAAMDRSMTASPNNRRQGDHHDDPNSLPPWEQRKASQVPYMTPDSPPLTQAEQHALPSLWASNDHGGQERSRSVPTSQDYPGASNYHWGMQAPLTAPPRKTSAPAMPYQPSRIAPGPKSAPQYPYYGRGPPSPPDSTRLSRDSTGQSRSPYHSPPLGSKPTITAMPGTMSARERSRSRHRPHVSQDETAKEEHKQNVPLGKRVKLAIKDIFRRDPVDESNFERIEDRHWAEE